MTAAAALSPGGCCSRSTGSGRLGDGDPGQTQIRFTFFDQTNRIGFSGVFAIASSATSGDNASVPSLVSGRHHFRVTAQVEDSLGSILATGTERLFVPCYLG